MLAALGGLVVIVVQGRIGRNENFLLGTGKAFARRMDREEDGYPRDNRALGRIKDSVDRGDLVGILDAMENISNKAEESVKANFEKVVDAFRNRFKLIRDLRCQLRITVIFNITTIAILLLGVVRSNWICQDECATIYVCISGIIVFCALCLIAWASLKGIAETT